MVSWFSQQLMKGGMLIDTRLDFVKINTVTKKDIIEIFPALFYIRSEDLMIRGRDFYAVYDPETKLWTKDRRRVLEIVDEDLYAYANTFPEEAHTVVKSCKSYITGQWRAFDSYCKLADDSYKELDSKLIFHSSDVLKTDYATQRLPYDLSHGNFYAYNKLMNTLYDEPERHKIEWAIGSILVGDSSDIQKFYVLYGDTGTGKSTVLHIIEQIFEGHWISFDAKQLGSLNSPFALEKFANNPLVAIQHDGDLSRLEDNTILNSLVSHETMMMNQKYRAPIDIRLVTTLFMGTNQPVRITDTKSGMLRRLITIEPSGRLLKPDEYDKVINNIQFEIGAIAQHCIEVYNQAGKNYYDRYTPITMMSYTNDIYTFVEDHYDLIMSNEYMQLEQLWELYRPWCEQVGAKFQIPKRVFKRELMPFFEKYADRKWMDDGQYKRHVYEGLKQDKFIDTVYDRNGNMHGPLQEEQTNRPEEVEVFSGKLPTPLDELCGECPAQYSSDEGTPTLAWRRVRSKLKDLDPTKEHYVNIPEDMKMIVIDFDLKDSEGNKDLHRNLAEAAQWPETYCELSKSGQAVHLHYFYDGDTSKLAPAYSDDIEVKVFTGNAALRRRVTKFNDKPIATISSGLPLKGDEKPVISFTEFYNEKALRTFIVNNMRKQYNQGTYPSIKFIDEGLSRAYESGMHYDVRDLRGVVTTFGAHSTHHSRECLRIIQNMKFVSEDALQAIRDSNEKPIAFFDIEVFPNLFVVCAKKQSGNPIPMINPTADQVKHFVESFRLIGFNNRRYDNHILYAAMLGYPVEKLYELSKQIISGSRNAFFGQAYNLSYADVYDFSSVKKSLKWFEINLGIHHVELGFDWDKPVDPISWDKVIEYCMYDVDATAAVFGARQDDFHARQMLAKLSGRAVNDPTRIHVTRIIFGEDKHPQRQFVYTDLSKQFPGYKYENGISTYRGEEVGEGGFVYSEPGIYFNVNVQDVESMHPHSLKELNLFGDTYTNRFWDIVQARLDIKHGNVESARKRLDGALVPYLEDASKEDLDHLSYALKIIINSVYGLTKASFDCEFKDPRNKDNIVAKRGALFMVDLMKALQAKGVQVVHIKTDSIKVHDADEELIQFIRDFGKKYGYNFETEAEYSRFCLLNKASYIAKRADNGEWEGKTDTVIDPYVFKTLFSHEEIVFNDYAILFNVTKNRNIYFRDPETHAIGNFVGKYGSFVPVLPGKAHGKEVVAVDGDKVSYLSGTKGYLWMPAEYMVEIGNYEDLDISYYEAKADALVAAINELYAKQGLEGSFEDFVKED